MFSRQIQPYQRQLIHLESATPLLLVVHGIVMLIALGSQPVTWWLVIFTAVLGGVSLIPRQVQAEIGLVRAGCLLIISLWLIFLTGGTNSFFLLWLFVITTIYPIVLRSPYNFYLPIVIGASYLIMALFPASQIPLIVVVARAFLLLYIGLLTQKLGSILNHTALEKDALIQQASDGIFITDLDGNLLEINQRGCQMIGCSRDELPKKNIRDIVVLEADAPPLRFGELLEGKTIQGERVLRDKNGRHIPVEISAKMIRGRRLQGIVRDITERKHAEETLRASESKYRTLFENMQEGFALQEIILDNQGKAIDFRFLDVNPAYEHHTGMKPQEIIGRKILEVLPTVDPRQIENYGKVALTGEPQLIEYYSEAFHRYFQVRAFSPQHARFATIFEDITERKLAEQQILQINRLYATLSQINQTIVRVEDRDELYQSICNIVVEFGKFSFAWIGLLDEVSGDIKPVAVHGLDLGNWPFPIVNINEGKFKEVLLASAIRTSRVMTSEDLRINKRLINLYDVVQENAYHSAAAVPLSQNGRNIGVLSMVSAEAGLFKDEHEIQLLNEMQLDISFALDKIQTEAAHKKAEEQLHQSEESFSKAFNSNMAALMITRLVDGKYVAVNKAYAKIVGFDSSELLDHLTTEFNIYLYPDQREKTLGLLFANGPLYNYETMIRNKSGEVRTVLASLDQLNFNGEACLLTTLVDITERKQAEKALRESRAQLAGIIDSAMDGIITVDADQRILLLNAAAEKMFLCSEASMIGQPLDQLIPAQFRTAHRKHIHQFGLTGATSRTISKLGSIRGLRADGSEFPLEASIAQTEVNDQKLYTVILRDITERKKTGERIKQQNQRLKALREIDTAILSADSVENIVSTALSHVRELIDCRRAALALIDWETNEVVVFDVETADKTSVSKGTRIPIALYQDLLETFSKNQPVLINDLSELSDMQTLFQALSQEGLRSVCMLPLFSQGSQIGAFNMSSEIPGFFNEERVSLGREVTNQVAIAITQNNLLASLKESNEELKERVLERESLVTDLTAKNAELEHFIYTVSHDLKSPLVTIKGFLGYLKQDALSGNVERLKGDIQRISNAVGKMQALLNDLLELSRIGRFINSPELVSFEQLAREAVGFVKGEIWKRGITVELQPNLPAVYGDKLRLLEVLKNLLDNAVKYMGDQPQPRIEIGQHGEESNKHIFYIKDNGMGVAPEYRDRIFGLFNKLDARSDGTGIGLTLVRSIIEYHGGRIWVDSEMGKGATFYFSLPRPI